jgi:hypothetical protein
MTATPSIDLPGWMAEQLSKEAFGATPAERKASGFQPGDSCNHLADSGARREEIAS